MSVRPLVQFRLAGIPVQVQAFFLLVLAVSASSSGSIASALVWVAVVTGSILWHELGHALAMRAFGNAPWIELHAMGGLTHWPAGAAPTARESLIVTAAGPGAGLLLGAGIWALAAAASPLPFLAELAIRDALWVNVGWSLFNLLPLLPLDGAHLLDHLTELVTGTREPRWVGWTSTVTGAAVAVYAVGQRSMWMALIGAMGAAQGWARARRGRHGWRAAARARSLDVVRKKARRAADRGDLAGVVSVLLPEARLGALPERDLAELVTALVKLEREDRLVALCRERLTAFARKDDVEPLARLSAEALADEGATEEALAVAQLAFRQLRIAYHAYDAACLLARLDRADEAVQWLERAIDAGLECRPDVLLGDPALAPLRARPDFLDIALRAGGEQETA